MSPFGYCRVSRHLWRNPSFKQARKKSRDASELAIYLVTCPHSNLLGLFSLPLAYAASDLGWSVPRVRKALRVVTKTGLAEYDKETHVVLVPWVLEWQEIQNRSQAEGAVKQLNNLPKTYLTKRLREKLDPHLTRISKGGDPYMEPLAEWFGGTVRGTVGDTVSTQSPDPLGTVRTAVSVAVTEAVTGTESVTETETVTARKGSNGEVSRLHPLDLKIALRVPPETPAEKFVSRLLRVTGEIHLRDLWLERFRRVPEAAVVNSVEELERAVNTGRIENPGAYFSTIFERHASYHLPPVAG